MTPAKRAERPANIEVGDHLFVRHPQRGPIAVRVTAAGRDGLTGVCERGGKHRVRYGDVLGAKQRIGIAFQAVETGADGVIVQDSQGRRRYLQHGEPAGLAEDTSEDTSTPVRGDDPLIDGRHRLSKAEMTMRTIPDNARLVLKLAPEPLMKAQIANRPGLALKDITDKAGRRSRHWVRSVKPMTAGAERRAKQKPDANEAPPMQHGDVVRFRHGDVEGKGRITASGRDGVTVHDGQREHQVRHEHLLGKAPEAEQAGPLTPPGAPEMAAASGGAQMPNQGAPGTATSVANFFPPDALKGLQPSSKVTQPFTTQKALYKASGEALGELKGWLNQGEGICSQLGYQTMGVSPEDADMTKPGGMLFIAPLKGEKRAKEKVEADYGGDWSKLKDTVRCTIAVDTMGDVKDVIDALQKGGMQLAQQPKDKFSAPTPEGYRDLNLSVRFKNGLIGEVQVHLKSMLMAKAQGHKSYEVMRTIDAKPRDKWTDQDKAKWQTAFGESQAVYSKAWAGSSSKPGTPDEKQGTPMNKAMGAGEAWEFYEREGAQFRRPAGEPGGVTDVLHGKQWKPYAGDRTRAYLEGDRIDDPLGGDGGGGGSGLPQPAAGGGDGVGQMSKAMPRKAGRKPAPLYIHRKVTNGADIAQHYRNQGCSAVTDPSDMHVTQCYSKAPVDWDAMGSAPDAVTVPPSNKRRTASLGDKGAHVLHFDSAQLEGRHQELRERGASHDYPSYKPHVTVSYGGKGFDQAKPWTGPIKLGPEVKQPIKEGWKPMQKAIGFFKATIHAQGQSSLFATPVTVKEHTTKDGVHVPAHTAIVHKRHDAPSTAPRQLPPRLQAEAQAAADQANTKIRRLAALSNRHTAYEAVVHHADGRKHLLAYVTGKSGHKLRDAMMKRALHVQRATGAGEDLRATPESPNKILLHGQDGLHGKRYGHVTWSGRTQRDAIMGGEHDYIGQAEAPAAASEASDDDDGPGAAEFKELQRKHAERMATADRLADAGKPVRMANPRYSHLTQLVSPDVSEPGKWRMTTFGSDRQPVGHVTLDTAKEAFRLALQEGNDPVAEPPRVIVRNTAEINDLAAARAAQPIKGDAAFDRYAAQWASLGGGKPKIAAARALQRDLADNPDDLAKMTVAKIHDAVEARLTAAPAAPLQDGYSATYYRNDKTHKTAIQPTREQAAAEAFANAPKSTRSISTAIARDGMHTGSDIRFHDRPFAAPAPRMVVRKDPGPEWHSATMAKMKTLPDESLRYIAKDAAEAARLNPDSSKAGRYADESHYASMELAARRDGRSAAPPVAQRDAKHFYVSAIDGKKRHLVAGPYHSHDAAKGMVEHVKRHAEEVQPDKAHPWVAWGTAGSSEPISTPLSEGWTPDSVSSYELGRIARHHDHPRDANPVAPHFDVPARHNWHKGWDEADQMIRSARGSGSAE